VIDALTVAALAVDSGRKIRRPNRTSGELALHAGGVGVVAEQTARVDRSGESAIGVEEHGLCEVFDHWLRIDAAKRLRHGDVLEAGGDLWMALLAGRCKADCQSAAG